MSTARTPIQVDYTLPVDEMTDEQIKKVMGVVSRHFDRNAEYTFGMPYTSSGSFAGLWNTNCTWDVGGGREIQGFTLAKDNRVIMITHTEDETEYWFTIGKLRGAK